MFNTNGNFILLKYSLFLLLLLLCVVNEPMTRKIRSVISVKPCKKILLKESLKKFEFNIKLLNETRSPDNYTTLSTCTDF